MNTQKYALVTGSSKGIGKAIAEALARKGYGLILVARSLDLLQALKEEWEAKYAVVVIPKAADLTQEGIGVELAEWCRAEGYPVSILINNAGISICAAFVKQPLEKWNKIMQLNMRVLVELTYAFLPLLEKNSPGYILNVGSLSSYMAVPTFSIYAASKAFVLSFSRGLSHEVVHRNIFVTCVCPGYTASNMFNTDGVKHLQKTLKRPPKFMTAEAVAKISLDALFAKKKEVIPGWKNWFMQKLVSWMPQNFIERMAAKELGFSPDK